MKIDRAIKELTELNKNYASNLWPEPNEAIELGIEALKRLQSNHAKLPGFKFPLLPGETEQ